MVVKGAGRREVGISRCKLLHIEWINKVLADRNRLNFAICLKETLQYKLLRSEFDSKVNTKEDSMYYNPYGTTLQQSNNTIFDFGDINVNNDKNRIK